MVIPTVVLKILGGAVAVGALASSVAVPTALSMNSSSSVVLHGFPPQYKSQYQDKCQLLITDESRGPEDKRYLLVCEGNGFSGVEFYFYYFEAEPQKFNRLDENGTSENYQTKVKVKTEVKGGIGAGGADFTASNGDWEDLIGKDLKNCSINKNDGKGKSSKWSVKCPKEGKSKDILLTPVIIQ